MEYLKANGTEIPAQVCGKQIDRDWDGRASRTVTLTMAYAQAAQLFVDGLNWAIVRRGDDAHGTAQEPRTAPTTVLQGRLQTTGMGRSQLKWANIHSWRKRCRNWRKH